MWPFVLQFSSSPFALIFVSLLMGALIKWSRWWWPRGIFIFYSALFLVKSILLTSRHEFCFPYCGCSHFEWIRWFGFRGKFIFYSGLPFGGRSHFGGVDLLDSEACEFIFYSALPVVESILWTLRHEFICFPSGGCSLSDSRCFWLWGRFVL